MPASVAVIEVIEALTALQVGIRGEMARRDLNATFAMSNSIEVDAEQDDSGVTGTLSALEYWVNVGSGTPPGSDVKERDIAEWMEAVGFEGDNAGLAFFIARKIRNEGSKAYRQGLPNAFETAIEAWENSALLRDLGQRTANEYGEAWVEVIRKQLN